MGCVFHARKITPPLYLVFFTAITSLSEQNEV
nr:MAG TPA: hypothetical protein [Caudoviricetes sp.]